MTSGESTMEVTGRHETPRAPGTPSERAVLDELKRGGPASRPQLASRTGLSKPTVASVLRKLEDAGLVRPAGQSSRGRGRSALVFDYQPSAGYVAGIHIGHSWIRCAVADLVGTVVARNDVQNTARSASTVVSTVSRVAHELARSAGIAWSQVVRTTVGSPGVFDPADGTLLLASRIRRWGRPGLIMELRRELGEMTTIANDANLAAVGELTAGHHPSATTFVYLMVGTGVGMGIVIDGKLHSGSRGAAGELAFLPFAEEGAPRPRAFGRRWGSFEEAASARGVVSTAVELGMSPRVSALQVFDAARRGHPAARTAVEREAERLATAIAAVAAVVDPELVILGGGIGSELTLLRDPMERRIHQLTPFHPQVVVSDLGDEAVLLGAIATALEMAGEPVYGRPPAGETSPAGRFSLHAPSQPSPAASGPVAAGNGELEPHPRPAVDGDADHGRGGARPRTPRRVHASG
ncbi:MAG TPA: ROK family transcriptional regulator [Candidatus Binatia bacterium]|nr:ROK family transcriptional regulator [Candidatus Binatia bacterium]